MLENAYELNITLFIDFKSAQANALWSTWELKRKWHTIVEMVGKCGGRSTTAECSSL